MYPALDNKVEYTEQAFELQTLNCILQQKIIASLLSTVSSNIQALADFFNLTTLK